MHLHKGDAENRFFVSVENEKYKFWVDERIPFSALFIVNNHNTTKKSKHPDYGNKSENQNKLEETICAQLDLDCLLHDERAANRPRLKYYFFIDSFRHFQQQ